MPIACSGGPSKPWIFLSWNAFISGFESFSAGIEGSLVAALIFTGRFAAKNRLFWSKHLDSAVYRYVLTTCRCAVGKSRTRYVTNQRATAWQAMGWLRDKQNSHCVWQNMQVLSDKLTSRCVTSYLSSLVTSKTETLMQQIALITSCRCVVSKSKVALYDQPTADCVTKLKDDWGTNRTVTVWQTMQPLSDKLTSRCVTSYPSAFARTKTVSCMQQVDSLTSCRCAVSKSRRRSVTNQRATAWQAMGWLRHKQNSHCVTNQADTISQTNYSLCAQAICPHWWQAKQDSYATSRSLTSCCCVVRKSWTRYVTNQRATAW